MKKLFILTLAVFTFVACDQAAKPTPAQALEQETVAAQGYILPALNGESYNFTEKINQKPVVIAFMAGFCGWCKKMIPYMDAIAQSVNPNEVDVIIGFMDSDPDSLKALEPVKNAKNINIYYNARKLMTENNVSGFPTIMLFKDGQEVETWHGYSPDHVESILETLEEIK